MDNYDKNKIIEGLSGIVTEVVVYDKIPSTSTFARGEEVGTLIVANEQSEGRGRSGNGFLSKKGGVYFSLVLPHDASDGVLLTLAAAAAVAQTSQNAVKNPEDVKIKWVNDVYYRGRKLAGILTERLLDKIVIGIGVNFFPVDFEGLSGTAISLYQSKNAPMSRSDFLVETIKRLHAFTAEEKEFLDYYRQNSIVLDKEITYVKDGATYSGKVTKIDENGHLRLEDGGELFGGEISVRLF